LPTNKQDVVTRGYREGTALPRVDYARAIGARRVHAVWSWADRSGHVYVVLLEPGGRKSVVSLSARALKEIGRTVPFAPPRPLPRDPTMRDDTRVDLLTRKMLPSGWMKG
jgi:hypothetical protein